MTVTAEMLGQVVKVFTKTEVDVDIEGTCISFGLQFGYHTAMVTMNVFDRDLSGDPPYPQAVLIMFALADKDAEVMDVSRPPLPDLLQLCNELQQGMDWCSIETRLTEKNKGKQAVFVSRCCTTSPDDIRRTLNGENGTEICTAMLHICSEFSMISPIVHQFASGKLEDLRYVQALMAEPAENRSN